MTAPTDTTSVASTDAAEVATGPLPALGARSIGRVRALWRLLAWSALPEAWTAAAGATSPPDGAAAALLATLRVLHQAPMPSGAAAQVAQARADAAAALALGPARVLGEGGPDADAGRLDLAAELLGVDGRARLALELAVVSALDPGTSQAGRVLAGRLGFASAADLGLLDELLATAQVGAALLRGLTDGDGRLRTIGALGRDRDRVLVQPGLLAFLDGGAPVGLPHAPGDGLPAAAQAAQPKGEGADGEEPLMLGGCPVQQRVPRPGGPSRWTPWAQLLQRVLGVDGAACPRCGGRMHLHAVVLGRALSRVLAGLEAARSSRAPPALA